MALPRGGSARPNPPEKRLGRANRPASSADSASERKAAHKPPLQSFGDRFWERFWARAIPGSTN
eukprot:336044-Alexandrium_andersonii.AAC.1